MFLAGTQYSGIDTTVNFTSISNPTITNAAFNPITRALNKSGYGNISRVRSPRVLHSWWSDRQRLSLVFSADAKGCRRRRELS